MGLQVLDAVAIGNGASSTGALPFMPCHFLFAPPSFHSPPVAFITSATSSVSHTTYSSHRWLASKRSAPPAVVARSNHTLISMLDERKSSGNGKIDLVEDNEEEDKKSWDVSSTCVKPVYRSSTLLQTPSAIKDYNIGESPDYRAVQVAEVHGLNLHEGSVSQMIDCVKDIVDFDLLLVMDKFNASDLMKEVTVHEAVDKRTRYAYKVHRLGEFASSRVIEDIDDPLYGNMGGPEEIELLHQVYHDILDCCKGLLEVLLKIKLTLQDEETLKQGLSRYLHQMDALEWLAPPMLQNKN